MKSNIVALLYDVDKTLTPKNMQEYGYITNIGYSADEFWQIVNKFSIENKMDPILAYMYMMVRCARGKFIVNRRTLNDLGKPVSFFPGVDSWFARINQYAAKKGLKVEHYIISSGLREIIEGMDIAHNFKDIFANYFVYDSDGIAIWPALTINYTSKTQFIFRINKGILDVNENDKLNEYTPDEDRRIPFSNMIYIGDGLTDVPSMKLVRLSGGHSIAVYNKNLAFANKMRAYGRVDFVAKADYSEGQGLEKIVTSIIDEVAARWQQEEYQRQFLSTAEEQLEQEKTSECFEQQTLDF